MIGWLGASLVMVCCAGLGFAMAGAYRNRPKELRNLLQAIRMLQQEIEFSNTPLVRAFFRVADRSTKPVANLFVTAAQTLQQGDRNVTVAAAFAAAIQDCQPVSSLRPPDFEAVMDFAKTLGTSDRVHQSQEIQVLLARLTSLEREARETQRANERLWQYLGVLAGLTLLVLLY